MLLIERFFLISLLIGIAVAQNAVERKPCGADEICIASYLCNNNEVVSSVVDLSVDSPVGVVCDITDVCCRISTKMTATLFNNKSEPTTAVRYPTAENVGCGQRNIDDIGFTLSTYANEAKFAEFPWMVAILNEVENKYLCGGALIAPTVILTAAHCVKNIEIANTLTIRAGEWDTNSLDELYPHQNRTVRQIIKHDDFDKSALYNDVALLVVDSPFALEQHVRPICLPPATANFDYSRCYATGWGKDKFGKNSTYQNILKKIDLPVVPHNNCQSTLRTTRLGKLFNLHDSFLCAGGELGKDTCQGDGGSPLFCPIEGEIDQFYQAGIVAWGLGCGEENIPAVYANVAHARKWIDKKLTDLRIDFSHFTA